MGEDLAQHERFMRAALAYGRRSQGSAAPNPSVGALVVSDGLVSGRGVTAPGGRPHAEPIALAQAGRLARGATLYVTLEPCSHVGQTPPCVDAIIGAGIARVVVGLLDPDPRVSGCGITRLREAGVEVIAPVLGAEARREHLGHILRVTEGRPRLTVKMAETADGFAAGLPGTPRLMITNALATAIVHRLRATNDAVMVGRGTVEDDDPLLTVRLPGADRLQPIRVVLDSELRIAGERRVLRSARGSPVIVVCGEEAKNKAVVAVEALGATVMQVTTTRTGLDLNAVLRSLGSSGMTRVLCEGGPKLASGFIEDGLADEVIILTGSAKIGSGRAALSNEARARLSNPQFFELDDEVGLGSDRLRHYTRVAPPCSQA